MRLTGSATEQAAAADALAALVALHRPNAVAALAALVECAQDGVTGVRDSLGHIIHILSHNNTHVVT